MKIVKEENNHLKDLLEAQKKIKTITMDTNNPYYKSKYASLKQIMEVVKPILNEHNYIIVQKVSNVEEKARVTTILLHITGESIETTLVIKPDKAGAQPLGSAISYAKRYTLGALVGAVSGEEDDDGEASTNHSKSKPIHTKPKEKKKEVKKEVKKEKLPNNWEAFHCKTCNKIEAYSKTKKIEHFRSSYDSNGKIVVSCLNCGNEAFLNEYKYEEAKK